MVVGQRASGPASPVGIRWFTKGQALVHPLQHVPGSCPWVCSIPTPHGDRCGPLGKSFYGSIIPARLGARQVPTPKETPFTRMFLEKGLASPRDRSYQIPVAMKQVTTNLEPLKSTHLLSHIFCGSGVQAQLSWVFTQGLRRLQSKCRHAVLSSGGGSSLPSSQGRWQNLVPCSCRTETSAPGGCPAFPAT